MCSIVMHAFIKSYTFVTGNFEITINLKCVNGHNERCRLFGLVIQLMANFFSIKLHSLYQSLAERVFLPLNQKKNHYKLDSD